MLGKSYFICLFLRSSLYLLIPAFIFIFNHDLSAIEIKQVKIIGSSIDLDAAKRVKEIKGELSKKDIEALGIEVTNEYHDKGYTTSYVERLTADNGVLEIHIKESKIAGINITGLDGKEKDAIASDLNSLIGNIYNRFLLERKAETIKRQYNMESVKIYPVNYKDTGDVFLSIQVTKKTKGNFYGGIGFEPIYGISPELGYYYPFTDTALDVFSRASYRDGRFRRAEGDIKYFLFPDNSPKGIYAGSNIAMFVEKWESRDYEYKRFSLSPVAGYRAVYQYMIMDLYVNEIISNIENYKGNGKELRDYDTRLTLDLGFSNRAALLSKRDSTDIKLSISPGKSDLNENPYLISYAEARSALSPYPSLRIIPRLYFYYTTSNERYFWQYVFDRRMLGFFNDYSASKWKNIAGLEIEHEIIPQFIYVGPFANTGYFLDESLKWKSKTGGGVKSTIEFKDAYIEIYFAWDLAKGPSKGGLAILAGGRF